MTAKKQIVMACAAVACTAGLAWMASGGRKPVDRRTYSQFLDQVHHGRVAGVIIAEGGHGSVQAAYRLKDGSRFSTILPSGYRDALRDLQESAVDVEIRESDARFLIDSASFFLLVAAWIFLLNRKLKKGPKLWAEA